MIIRPLHLLRKIDWVFTSSIAILLAVGLIMLYSISLGSGDVQDVLNFKKQLIFVSIGVFFYFLFSLWVDYRAMYKMSGLFFIFGVFLLILVLIFGSDIRGTTGWFNFGFFSLQPVEFVKISMVLFFAYFFSQKALLIRQWSTVLLSAVPLIICLALIMMQPDFGSSVILGVLWLGLSLMAGMRWSQLGVLFGSGFFGAILMWFFAFADYQKNRILVFLNPELDPLGVGYNVTQAIIAVGSGKWFGRGLSFGSQSKLKFLPEAQTDFIFAVIAEQLGLFGVVLIITLFAVILFRLISSARSIRDNFGIYILLGTFFIIFIQMSINIGMNLGLLPVTGLTLPLLSYGGSSMLSTLILLGIAQGVVARNRV